MTPRPGFSRSRTPPAFHSYRLTQFQVTRPFSQFALDSHINYLTVSMWTRRTEAKNGIECNLVAAETILSAFIPRGGSVRDTVQFSRSRLERNLHSYGVNRSVAREQHGKCSASLKRVQRQHPGRLCVQLACERPKRDHFSSQ